MSRVLENTRDGSRLGNNSACRKEEKNEANSWWGLLGIVLVTCDSRNVGKSGPGDNAHATGFP